MDYRSAFGSCNTLLENCRSDIQHFLETSSSTKQERRDLPNFAKFFAEIDAADRCRAPEVFLAALKNWSASTSNLFKYVHTFPPFAQTNSSWSQRTRGRGTAGSGSQQ